MADKPLKIPSTILASDEFGASAKLVLSYLLANAEYLIPETITKAALARTLGLSVGQVSDALIDLAGAHMVTFFSAVDAPEVTAFQATSLACHIEIRVELMKGVTKDGQKTMTELENQANDRAVVDGFTYRFAITPDPDRGEGETTCFLNVWQLDDDGSDLVHRIQGVQFENEQDAAEWWEQYTAQEPMAILEWLIAQPHHDFDATQSLWNVFLAPETFDLLVGTLQEAYVDDPDSLARLAEFDSAGEIPLHGRLYCRAAPDDEGAYRFGDAAMEEIVAEEAAVSAEETIQEEEPVVEPDEEGDAERGDEENGPVADPEWLKAAKPPRKRA